MGLTCWIDASAGIAGDMLLGALIDAGASVDAVVGAVEAVAPGLVRISTAEVVRHGMRAVKVDVAPREGHDEHHDGHGGHQHRAWREIDAMIAGADLPVAVGQLARQVFERIAVAEGRAHGLNPAEVHFHEVGAWDSIADIVGCCAALHDLGVERRSVGEIAVGSGMIEMAHGVLAVPGPAVVELSSGLLVRSGPAATELATPTGMAFLAGQEQGPVPAMTVVASGTGAGTRDFPGHANITRVVLGREVGSGTLQQLSILECNVDDLDPRLWPGILKTLLAAGAQDAWLTPILMKKGRPAHTLSVLTDDPGMMRGLVFAHTSTLGIREHRVERAALEREWRPVVVQGHQVRVKVALLEDRVVNAEPEFEDVAHLASALDVSEATALALAQEAARSLH